MKTHSLTNNKKPDFQFIILMGYLVLLLLRLGYLSAFGNALPQYTFTSVLTEVLVSQNPYSTTTYTSYSTTIIETETSYYFDTTKYLTSTYGYTDALEPPTYTTDVLQPAATTISTVSNPVVEITNYPVIPSYSELAGSSSVVTSLISSPAGDTVLSSIMSSVGTSAPYDESNNYLTEIDGTETCLYYYQTTDDPEDIVYETIYSYHSIFITEIIYATSFI